MKNYLFLLPVFNDWKSLNLLLKKINEEIGEKSKYSHILIINDNSSEKINVENNLVKNFKSFKVISLKKNLGSQRCIAVGLKYLQKENKDYIITILDSDGEDDPSKINEMIDMAINAPDFIITSNRTNRKENFFFKLLYSLHKIVTFLLSAKWISFGNFSSFDSRNLKMILKNNNTWLAYSSAIALNCRIKRLYAKRKQRYFGKSKVNFSSLALHSLRIISVLYKRVLIFSFIYITTIIYLNYLDKSFIVFLFVFFFIIFNILILTVRVLMNIKNLNFWDDYIKEIKQINNY